MPMTAFIGVRISWLIVARNELLASLAASACERASRASWNSRAFSMATVACSESPDRNSSSASLKGSPPVRHTAIAPLTAVPASSGATISRSFPCRLVPGIWIARGSACVSLMYSA